MSLRPHADVVRPPKLAADRARRTPRPLRPTARRTGDTRVRLRPTRLVRTAGHDAGAWAFTDGCAFDAAGNLWVTLLSANRVVVITPELDVVTLVDDPDGILVSSPTSIAFGGDDGRDVYIGSIVTDYVLKGRSPVAGRAPGR